MWGAYVTSYFKNNLKKTEFNVIIIELSYIQLKNSLTLNNQNRQNPIAKLKLY